MKLGFIDYYLNEFHANHYPEWLRCSAGEPVEIYAWAETEKNQTTDEWCAEHGAISCESIEEVCRKADYILLLSPDNPEKHLGYAEKILPFRKPTFIDKTFAPDLATAKEIFALAKKYGTPMFSSSSLRFAAEFAEYKGKATHVLAEGGGGHFDVEVIHPLEMCSFFMGNGAESLYTERIGETLTVLVRYPDGRRATVYFSVRCHGLGYRAAVYTDEGKQFVSAEGNFFQSMCDAMVGFFRGGDAPVSPEDTLEAIRLRDAVLSCDGEWVKIEK